jgi:hypothetical protein
MKTMKIGLAAVGDQNLRPVSSQVAARSACGQRGVARPRLGEGEGASKSG